MFSNQAHFILLSSFILLFTACGSVYDQAEVAKVKRVAVVGYTMDYNLSTTGALKSVFTGGEKKMGMTKVTNKVVETRVSKASYDYLVKNLKKSGWQVADPKATAKSPSLKRFYNRRVKTGFLPLQDHHERYKRNGIPRYETIAGLRGSGELSKIAKELKVDALIFVYTDTNIGNPLALIGSTNYSSKILFDVYQPRGEKFILRMSVQGDSIDEMKDVGSFDNVTQSNSFKGFQKACNKLMSDLKKKI
ncbi:MAG: hypothetical protein AAF203_10830 [Pseudomonadota bacterium]